MDGDQVPSDVERLVLAGWRCGWQPPWEQGSPLLDTAAALDAADAADQLEHDRIMAAAEGDGYLRPLTPPDVLPADW